jgi:hypothetical protein
VFDPNAAAKVAAAGYKSLGLSPWEASRNEGAGGGWGQHLGQSFQKGGAMNPINLGHLAGGGGSDGSQGKHHHKDPPTGLDKFWKRYHKWMKHTHKQEARLSERIDIATTHAGWPASSGGDTTSPSEANHLINMWKNQLGNYYSERHKMNDVESHLKRIKHHTQGHSPEAKAKRKAIDKYLKNLKGRRHALFGLTGKGGLVFEAKDEIAQLKGGLAASRDQAALDQTAMGTERFQLLTEFGGNIQGLGGLLTAPNPSPLPGGGGGGHHHNPPPITSGPDAGGYVGNHPGGAYKVTHNTVVNNYQTQPNDPHTWSKTMKYNLEAMA